MLIRFLPPTLIPRKRATKLVATDFNSLPLVNAYPSWAGHSIIAAAISSRVRNWSSLSFDLDHIAGPQIRRPVMAGDGWKPFP